MEEGVHGTGSGSISKWVDGYGWLFVFASAVSFIAGLAAISKNSASTASLELQALIFGATGYTILRRENAALVLVWISVGLSGVGVLFRGLVPLDALLWLAWLGLAVWYSTQHGMRCAETSSAETEQPTSGVTQPPVDAELSSTSRIDGLERNPPSLEYTPEAGEMRTDLREETPSQLSELTVPVEADAKPRLLAVIIVVSVVLIPSTAMVVYLSATMPRNTPLASSPFVSSQAQNSPAPRAQNDSNKRATNNGWSLDDFLDRQAAKNGSTPPATTTSKPETPTCPAGIPAGVTVAPIKNIHTITGSDGELEWRDWAYSEKGYYNGWYLSFKVANASRFCVTTVRYQAIVESGTGRQWKTAGRDWYGAPLSPGWSESLGNL